MSEYWKSLPRKFCDICKCWFADNKASIDFHEKGKRHQENVQKRINELQKKGLKEYEEQKYIENEMQKIEQAALQAFKKDLQNNPDLAAQYHISIPSDKGDKSTVGDTKAPKKEQNESLKRELEKFQEIKKELKDDFKDLYHCSETTSVGDKNDAKKEMNIKEEEEEKEQEEKEDGEDEKKKNLSAKNENPETLVSQETVKLWYEAVSDEGYTYYWNTETAASQWEPPEEGFVSLDEQNQQKLVEDGTNSSSCKAENSSEEENENEEEIDRSDKDDSDEIPFDAIGPQPKPDPYGQWIPVEHKIEKPVDLQLPEKTENILEASIPITNDDIKVKFKEKTVGHLSDAFSSEDSSFRKRKNIGDVKRNVRRRTREDD